MRKLRSNLAVALVLAAALSGITGPSMAGMIVYDPKNHAQNLLQALRALDQLRTMTRQLETELKMIQSLGVSESADIQGVMRRMQELLLQTDGLGFDVGRIAKDFETLYPQEYDSADYRRIAEQAARWTAQNRAAVQESMEATSLAAENLARHDRRLQELLAASDSAVGTTSAVQAGNQILGSLSAQIADMSALIIAQNRAVDSKAAEEEARKAQQKALHEQLWQGIDDTSVEPPAIDTAGAATLY